MSDTLRIIPLGGLGEVGKNMTVYELGDEIVVVDAGLAFPRDEHLGRRSPAAGHRLPRGPLRPCGDPHARPRGSRRRPAVPPARGRRRIGHRDAADARAREVEARRARARAEGGARRRLAGRRAARARPVPRRARPRRALDPRLGRARHRDTGGARRAHGRLEARPHARRRAEDRRRQARRDRQPRRRSPPRRLDERRASGQHGLGAPRRRGVPLDLPAAQREDPRRLVRVEHPSHAAGS